MVACVLAKEAQARRRHLGERGNGTPARAKDARGKPGCETLRPPALCFEVPARQTRLGSEGPGRRRGRCAAPGAGTAVEGSGGPPLRSGQERIRARACRGHFLQGSTDSNDERCPKRAGGGVSRCDGRLQAQLRWARAARSGVALAHHALPLGVALSRSA